MKIANKTVASETFELKLIVQISFKADFQLCYHNEMYDEKKVVLRGNHYSRIFFIKESHFNFFCMLLIQNQNLLSNEFAEISLYQNGILIKKRSYHISTYLSYDGWFIFEEKINRAK
jgi:hypothetical protein